MTMPVVFLWVACWYGILECTYLILISAQIASESADSIAPIHMKHVYIPVSHTNRLPIKNTIGVVMNRLVGMSLNNTGGLPLSTYAPRGVGAGVKSPIHLHCALHAKRWGVGGGRGGPDVKLCMYLIS